MENKSSTFITTKKCKIQFSLPELDDSKIVEHSVYVDESKLTEQPRHDMIMGCDLMTELGIKLDFKDRVMTWDGASTPMKSQDLDSLLSIKSAHKWGCK